MLYLVEGKDLPAMDYTGKSDPFINVLVVDGKGKTRQIYQTETIEQTLTPVWNESVRIKDSYLSSDNVAFRFNVYDRDAFTNDYMGHFEIPIADMKKSFENWFNLHPKPGKKNKEVSGLVLVKCVSQSDAVDTNKLLTEATQKNPCW
jgi:Ca2+-dependent lipid-binding protein